MIKCKEGASSPCGKNICCFCCAEKSKCKDLCDSVESFHSEQEVSELCCEAITEETALTAFQERNLNIIEQMTSVLQLKKQLEEQEKAIREQLEKAMEQYGVKSFDCGNLKVIYKAAYQRTGVDSKRLKADFPKVFKEVQTTTPVKASVSISLK